MCLQVFIDRTLLKVTPVVISWFKSAGVPLFAITSFYILNLVTRTALFYARGIFLAAAFSLFRIGVSMQMLREGWSPFLKLYTTADCKA